MSTIVGMEFDHARFITGSPKAGTARPERYVVTAVRCGMVYYRPVNHPTNHATHCIEIEKFPDVVKTEENTP